MPAPGTTLQDNDLNKRRAAIESGFFGRVSARWSSAQSHLNEFLDAEAGGNQWKALALNSPMMAASIQKLSVLPWVREFQKMKRPSPETWGQNSSVGVLMRSPKFSGGVHVPSAALNDM